MKNQTRTPSRPARITVEVALWALVAVTALALRLADLDAAPLSAPEAREATLAWRAATGQGMPEAGYSPLLLAANALLFSLCGAGDALARLWPALFGSALALVPLLFRERIGRVGALAAGLGMAFSPTALFASRQLDGAVVAAAGGMAFLGGLVRFRDTGQRRWLILAAGSLALAVTSSSSTYGLLLGLGLSGGVLAWAWPGGKGGSEGGIGPHLGRMLLVFLLAVLVLSTGFGWNPGGLGAAGDLLAAWFARFGPGSTAVASPLTLLAIYEPLALFFGLGGAVWAARRGHRFGVLAGLWAGLGALLLGVMPGRAPVDVLWAVVPLVLLTGVAVEALVRSLQASGAWLGEGLYALLVLVLWVHFHLALARYGVRSDPGILSLAFLSLALQLSVAMIFALTMSVDVTWRGIVVGTGVALLVATLSAGWGVAYVRPADPRELLVHQPTAVEVRDLVETLRDLSWRETGVPTRLGFTFEAAPESVLAWYLRDFSAARQVERLHAEQLGALAVTARQDLALPGMPGGVEYVGQDFALRRSWDPRMVRCAWRWPLECNAAMAWLMFRRTPAPPAVEQSAVLWLRPDVAGAEVLP